MDSHRTSWLPSAALVVVTWAILLWSPNFRRTDDVRAQAFGGDALQEWLGSSVARSEPDRLYDLDHIIALQHDAEFVGYRFKADAYFPMVYPPFYYVALRPLAYCSARQAAYILFLGVVICAGAAFWLLARANIAPRAAPYLGGVLTLGLLYVPLLVSLCTAQKSAFALLVFVLTYHLYRHNRRFPAGVAAGLLCFKPQLALVAVAVFLWRREWRLLAGFGVCGCFLLLLCLPVGLDSCRDYFAFARSAGDYTRTGGYELAQSHSIYGFLALVTSGGAGIKWAMWMGLTAVGFLLSKICRPPNKSVESETHVDLMFAAIVLATPLASPHFYTYDLAILNLPMFLLWNVSLRDAKYRSLGWVAGMLYVGGAITVQIAEVSGIQISVLLMLGSLWWLYWISAYGAVAIGQTTARRVATA